MRPRLALAIIALVAAVLALSLRRCGPEPVTPPPAKPRAVELPALPSAPPPVPPARSVAPAAPQHRPDRLQPYLEKLGRARLVRDARRLAELRAEAPAAFESDLDWLVSRLSADLFTAAGAAEFVRAFGLRRAIPELAEALAHPSDPFLKETVIDVLASLGGDAAAVPLLAALRSDGDPGVRARCAAALARFQGPEAYHALVAALRDPDPDVRSAASQSLARLPSQEAVRILVEALARESDPRVQADLASAAYGAGGEAWREPIVGALRDGGIDEIDRRRRIHGPARYARSYDRSFFESGRQPPFPLDPARRRIGITLELGSIPMKEVAAAIFDAAPFDRYRMWFYFRKAEEYPAPRAYDSYGTPLGDVPYGALDGAVYLRFRDPLSFSAGVLGYTNGCEAYVTSASLLHELGHAFGRLGDEYAGGSAFDAPNVAPAAPPSWQPLIEAGHLGTPPRRDEGRFIPSENCHLGNRATDARFCPVCQLAIHARIAELTGAAPPW